MNPHSTYDDYLSGLWYNLPFEIKAPDKRRWVFAGFNKVPRNTIHKKIDATDVRQCLYFEDALVWARQHYMATGMGYFLGRSLFAEDRLTCIDLDRKDPSISQEDMDRQDAVIRTSRSFTEYSVSGKGAHVWVNGSIGPGRRRDSIEVYSQERFMLCTGRPLPGYHIPIVNQQHMLDNMSSSMGVINGLPGKYELNDIPASVSDEEIYNKLATAANGGKFLTLWSGNWQSIYPTQSQSEADLALITLLAFYTKSDEQLVRLFHYSALGKRDKAHRKDYLARSIGQARVPLDQIPSITIDVDNFLKNSMKRPQVGNGGEIRQ